MRLGKFYESAIKHGMQADPRSIKLINKQLSDSRKNYKKLSKSQKGRFDKESLSNPYADSRILYGDRERQVKRILLGIDIDVGELLLADRLRQKGQAIDLVLSHHPSGFAYAGFYGVMRLQIDILTDAGISKDIAEEFTNKRIKEVERRVISANHNRAVDVAKILDLPFMCLHTPSDNCVYDYIQKLMDSRKPKSLEVILNILRQIPEYKDADRHKAGPKIISGNPKNKPGKILVEMTGGTEGSKELFGRLSQSGVGTIIGMHLSEEHFKKVETEHINVIIAGHISSDTLGLNLLLDKIEKNERFEVISCSGFRRVKR